MSSAPQPPVRVSASGALTAFVDENTTLTALLAGRRALAPVPVLGRDGGDLVPLALCAGRDYNESAPPGWIAHVRALADRIPGQGWGTPRRPVFVTSSNFGVGSLHAFRRTGDAAHLDYGTPFRSVDWLVREFGWGPNVTTFSHACVSSHLGLLQASRVISAGLADDALVFTFDFLSPFVAGGFHALKILNADLPAPYQDRATGSIGLGDGAAFAVLSRGRGDFALVAQSLHNEMHHFTANQADGAGFNACLAPIVAAARGRRFWVKGHGTGTLEAGKLETAALHKYFAGAPLVGWKGGLGHTLGSCGLVELVIAIAAMRHGRVPGTVGSGGPTFTPDVALESFATAGFDGVLCTSNAFGGAHAALLLSHV